jgi:hypothetical protein
LGLTRRRPGLDMARGRVGSDPVPDVVKIP